MIHYLMRGFTFSDWVEYHDLVSEDIDKQARDYQHGTAITSILVDGPTINPELQDNCGRFKVRHFGVAVSKISVLSIL